MKKGIFLSDGSADFPFSLSFAPQITTATEANNNKHGVYEKPHRKIK